MIDQAAEILKLVGMARTTSGQNIALIGVTLDRARRNLWRPILACFNGRWSKDWLIDSVDTVNMILRFKNGSRVQCYGLNRPEQLRGHRFTAVYLDEAATDCEHALMIQLATILMPMERPEPPPKPVFGL